MGATARNPVARRYSGSGGPRFLRVALARTIALAIDTQQAIRARAGPSLGARPRTPWARSVSTSDMVSARYTPRTSGAPTRYAIARRGWNRPIATNEHTGRLGRAIQK